MTDSLVNLNSNKKEECQMGTEVEDNIHRLQVVSDKNNPREATALLSELLTEAKIMNQYLLQIVGTENKVHASDIELKE